LNTDSLRAEREHLANLLEALQRCAFFLDSAATAVEWPVAGPGLKLRQKDESLFQALAAFNERFSKMQDTMAAAMRHSALLMGEATTPFLRVLAFFEKLRVIDSVESWQLCRAARNLGAHDYETNYDLIAEHFNELHALQPVLIPAAERLLELCAQSLDARPATADFEAEFLQVCSKFAKRIPVVG
jgi:hypothetical protein